MINDKIHQHINNIWYQDNKLYYLLLPFSILFYLISTLRKFYYCTLYKQKSFSAAVIVVGNISVGGTGKTPMVIYLVEQLRNNGNTPGIVTRAYKSNIKHSKLVEKSSVASEVGDEPLLLANRTNVPVIAGPDRVNNIDKLLNEHQCDIIICDDGLQDYRFKHDIEINMVDGDRQFGNGNLLPAGPLREPASRIQQSDFIVSTRNPIPEVSHYCMQLVFNRVIQLSNKNVNEDLKSWAGKTVHAVTGIGNPEQFYEMLEALKINIIRHPFPDHAVFSTNDLQFNDKYPVLMTEKDAVKCRDLGVDNTWYVPVNSSIPDEFMSDLNIKLREING